MNKVILIGFLVVCIAAMAYGVTEKIWVRNCDGDTCSEKCNAKVSEVRADYSTSKSTCITNNGASECLCTYNSPSASSTLLNWSILSLMAISAATVQFR